jgi:HEPN domain-containing protein
MYAEQSTFDWCRYGHWNTSAEKARLSAFLLWQTCERDKLAALQNEAHYTNGDADLALLEGFRRESAVALELIIKAVIAEQFRRRRASESERVPKTHDIPKLWLEAGLPELERDDKYRLLLFKSVLYWSGRYAMPQSAEAWAEENRAFAELEGPAQREGKFIFKTPISYGWEEFDRLFQIARARWFELGN